jgi:hypothetical protein
VFVFNLVVRSEKLSIGSLSTGCNGLLRVLSQFDQFDVALAMALIAVS